MTIKSLSGVYLASGYALKASYNGIDIAANAGVGGSGLTLTGYGFVENKGVERGAGVNAADYYNDGVRLNAGGDVTNELVTSYIGGTTGIYVKGGGAVTNFGQVRGTRATSAAIDITGAGQIDNFGTIIGVGQGIRVGGGGSLRNGDSDNTHALVQGGAGAAISGGAGTVVNYGSIIGDTVGYGVDIGGGSVINGSNADTSALISGEFGVGSGGPATVTNFGTVLGSLQSGVYIAGGGLMVNGSAIDITALVAGTGGVVMEFAAGTVANFGTVRSSSGMNGVAGIELVVGGAVTNGAATDPLALVQGYTGVEVKGAFGKIANFGTILGLGQTGQAGVEATYGGTVTNGALGGARALIAGADGVDLGKVGGVVNFGQIVGEVGSGVALSGLGSVTNLGTIAGAGGYGVDLQAGGSVTNGGGANRSALIEGNFGLEIQGAAGTVSNFGTILGEGVYAFGVYLRTGGTLTNGSVNNATAVIEGQVGAELQSGASAVNFGTLWGTGDTGGSGAYLLNGAHLTNGAAGSAAALVEGVTGVIAGSGATVTNFGTIEGAGGVAVQFSGAGDVLEVEAGCVFKGAIKGGGGKLDLASGAGTLTGLLSASGAVTVSGSMAATTFTGFSAVEVGLGASFTLAGAGAITAGQALIDAGALSVGAALTSAGSVSLSGAFSGAGTLALTGGKASLGAGTSLTIANVSVSGAATSVSVATGLAYAGKWRQSGGTLSVASGKTLGLTGASDSFAGTLSGAGEVAVTGTLTLGAAGASLTGGGFLALSNLASNSIVGATAATTLTNVKGEIFGAGDLGGGKLTLINKVAGVIEANGSVALIINTGAATITNAGKIEAVGAGGLTIAGAVDNTGALIAGSSLLKVDGAVTGAGTGVVGTGTLDLASTFSQNVTFSAGSTGTLELAHAQAYAGQITGLSTVNALDLGDIAFISGKTKATFSGTAASGTLSVADGTHAAHIKLLGDYTASTFTVSSDGHGGSKVIDPTTSPSASRFAASMAAFAIHSGDASASDTPMHGRYHPMLALPRHAVIA